MAAYADLAPLPDFGSKFVFEILAVGWLSRDANYPRGDVACEVYERLKELLRDAWQPFAAGGVHECDLCRFEPESSNGANLFVSDGKCIFCAPAMILHYMNAHHYAPPEKFCQAVLKCPGTRTMEYKRLLLASGWRRTPPSQQSPVDPAL